VKHGWQEYTGGNGTQTRAPEARITDNLRRKINSPKTLYKKITKKLDHREKGGFRTRPYEEGAIK